MNPLCRRMRCSENFCRLHWATDSDDVPVRDLLPRVRLRSRGSCQGCCAPWMTAAVAGNGTAESGACRDFGGRFGLSAGARGFHGRCRRGRWMRGGRVSCDLGTRGRRRSRMSAGCLVFSTGLVRDQTLNRTVSGVSVAHGRFLLHGGPSPRRLPRARPVLPSNGRGVIRGCGSQRAGSAACCDGLH